jgi:tetratricopeptide (TPR) repeat protein
MTDKKTSEIDELLARGRWAQARKLLAAQRQNDPTNHWVITQIGVCFYERRKYQTALEYFVEARRYKPDCPLTLWHLAGALNALGKHGQAISIYTWLLRSNVTPEEDPCWETTQWTESLKADCIFRIGVCFENFGKKQKAEECFRQYLYLLSIGMEGPTAPPADVQPSKTCHPLKGFPTATSKIQ